VAARHGDRPCRACRVKLYYTWRLILAGTAIFGYTGVHRAALNPMGRTQEPQVAVGAATKPLSRSEASSTKNDNSRDSGGKRELRLHRWAWRLPKPRVGSSSLSRATFEFNYTRVFLILSSGT
jgi:hypothetical protein